MWTRAAVLTSGSGAWNQARRVPGDQGTHWLSSILVGGVSQGKHSALLKTATTNKKKWVWTEPRRHQCLINYRKGENPQRRLSKLVKEKTRRVICQ